MAYRADGWHDLVFSNLHRPLEGRPVDGARKPYRAQPQRGGVQDEALEGVAKRLLRMWLPDDLCGDVGACTKDDGAGQPVLAFALVPTPLYAWAVGRSVRRYRASVAMSMEASAGCV